MPVVRFRLVLGDHFLDVLDFGGDDTVGVVADQLLASFDTEIALPTFQRGGTRLPRSARLKDVVQPLESPSALPELTLVQSAEAASPN